MRMLNSPRFWVVVAVLLASSAGALISAERSSSAMARTSAKFLGSLTAEQRQQASFAFGSDERMRWHFIPTETFPRKGLTIKEMTPLQRGLAHDLLKAGLSQRGYLTTSSILNLETVLGA